MASRLVTESGADDPFPARFYIEQHGNRNTHPAKVLEVIIKDFLMLPADPQ
jgi:hypothetical protein